MQNSYLFYSDNLFLSYLSIAVLNILLDRKCKNTSISGHTEQFRVTSEA